MTTLMIQNWVCWCIAFLALAAYFLIWRDILDTKFHKTAPDKKWFEVSSILVAVLPLLGLLGTVIGLLEAFTGLGARGEALSGGVGDALLTTQLGLVLAVPAWILLSYLSSQTHRLQSTQLVTQHASNNSVHQETSVSQGDYR